MKTNKIQIFTTIIVVSIFSLTLCAQEKEMIKFDVNGLYITTAKYTKAQIVEKLGQPSKYQAQEENYDFCEYYYYNNSRFAFENGELVEFLVEDPQFKCFGGKVEIGSLLNIVENLPSCRFVLLDRNVFNMITYSELWTGYSERPVTIGHKGGVVVSVSYSDPL